MLVRVWGLWAPVLIAVLGGNAAAQSDVDRQFGLVLRFLPADARAGAALLIPQSDGFVTHRAGSNNYVCLGDPPGDGRLSLQCYHRSLGPFLELQRTLSRQDLRGAAFRERLCAEIAAGAIEVPQPAYLLDLSGARRADGGMPDSVTVYHLFQMPYATQSSTGLTEVEPAPGVPWLHHAGTCDAHLMWSERRAVSDSRQRP